MSNTVYTKKQRSNNTLDVAKHYAANKFQIQRKRKLKNILEGMRVRPETIIKYNLQKEAKAQGLEVKVVEKANPVRLLRTGSKEATDIENKIQAKLDEYDLEIGKNGRGKIPNG